MSFVHNSTKMSNSGFKGNSAPHSYPRSFHFVVLPHLRLLFLTLWPKLPCEHVCIQVAGIGKSRQEIFLQFITEILFITSTDNLLVKLSHITTTRQSPTACPSEAPEEVENVHSLFSCFLLRKSILSFYALWLLFYF